jgi:hypothetical protein
MDQEIKKNIVEKIIASSTFSNKEVLKGLLDFIFRATEKGISLKEIDIAVDYFKRKDGFIPGDDTIVRVNIHKLRQLLEKYYSEEGREEKIRLQIPKGSYTTVFDSELKIEEPESKFQLKNILIILSVILVISLIINIFFTHTFLNGIQPENHPVWGNYLMSNKPICIILGDPFFYSKRDSLGKTIIYRDLEINSVEDLAQKNDKQLQKSDYAYFSKNNVLPLADIMAILSSNNKNIELHALSEVNPDNLKSSNQVFIANINSFGFFKQYLDKTSIRISLNPRKIFVINKLDTTFYEVPEKVGDYYNDYSFMVKIPGPNHNTICMIGDFHSSGNKGLSGFLRDNSQMKSLEEFAIKKYSNFPSYFEMIVKVSSYHYGDVKTEIIYFNKLQINQENQFSVPEMMN